MYFLNSPTGKSLANKGISSSGVGNLNVSVVRKFKIPLPTLKEQHRTVAKLDVIFSEINKSVDILEKKKLHADSIKRISLMTLINDYKNVKSYTLNDVCTKITDGSHNPPKVSTDNSYIMLSSKNIFDNEINYKNPRYISKEDFYLENKRTDVNKGDVLLTIVGTIGRCAVVKSDNTKFTLQRSVAVLKPNKLIDSSFLMFLLQSLISDFKSRSAGVAQKGIYLKQIRNTTIKIPLLNEQKALVKKIYNLQKELDVLNEIIIKQNKNLESLKSSVFSSILKNEIT